MRVLRSWLARFLVFVLAIFGRAPGPALSALAKKHRATSAAHLGGHVGANRPNGAALLSRFGNPLGRRRRAYVRARRRKSRHRTTVAEQLLLESEAAALFPVPRDLAESFRAQRRYRPSKGRK